MSLQHAISVHRNRLPVFVVLAGFALGLGLVPAIHAATFTVNSTADAVDANPGDDLAILVSRNSDARTWVHIKDALSGAFIKNVWFQGDFKPQDFAVLPDMDANPGSELAVLGIKAGGQVQVEIKDAKTIAFINQVNFP